MYGVMDRLQKEITCEEMLEVAEEMNKKYGSRDAVEAWIGDRFGAKNKDRVIKLFEARRDCLKTIAEDEFPSVDSPQVSSLQMQPGLAIEVEHTVPWPFLAEPRLAA